MLEIALFSGEKIYTADKSFTWPPVATNFKSVWSKVKFQRGLRQTNFNSLAREKEGLSTNPSFLDTCMLPFPPHGYQDDIWWKRDVHRIRVLENRNKCQLNYVLGDIKCCLKLEHETVFLYGRRTRPRIDALNWAEDHEFDGHPAYLVPFEHFLN